ncbi:DUF432 domain-containing protein [Thermococcus sp. M39]|uniref:DUF432 domain-containing protein n=1 Tax=unclassified Thermococcus TaxID=2627626 RepID=UPI00143A2131|nr:MULTISPECIES: DUF432 domain-containing protein [unclassified Thermococcus]NJE09203.1 DUF432 domain-containing protein [Thermococcus sp. M39]NJE13761.1 DUF432 domain-containing protein [Thermococcus sp. LS2]
MFGEYELRTRFIKVFDKKIHLTEETDEIVVYRRDEIKRIIKKADRLKILPSPAIGYGVKLLMVKLNEPIAVPPKDAISGYIEVPIEVDVKVGDLTIDHFILGKEKYALYGTVDVGVITRYHKSKFYVKEPDSVGIAKVIISNPSKEWKLIERIVFPIKDSVMFYTKDKAYYPLLIVTLKTAVPEVNNTGKPPKDGLIPTREALSLPNFLMRW